MSERQEDGRPKKDDDGDANESTDNDGQDSQELSTVDDWLDLARIFAENEMEIFVLSLYLLCERPDLLERNQQLARVVRHALRGREVLLPDSLSAELCEKFQQKFGIDLKRWYRQQQLQANRERLSNKSVIVQGGSNESTGTRSNTYNKNRHKKLKGAIHKVKDIIRYRKKRRPKVASRRGNYVRQKPKTVFEIIADRVEDRQDKQINDMILEEFRKEGLNFDDDTFSPQETTSQRNYPGKTHKTLEGYLKKIKNKMNKHERPVNHKFDIDDVVTESTIKRFTDGDNTVIDKIIEEEARNRNLSFETDNYREPQDGSEATETMPELLRNENLNFDNEISPWPEQKPRAASQSGSKRKKTDIDTKTSPENETGSDELSPLPRRNTGNVSLYQQLLRDMPQQEPHVPPVNQNDEEAQNPNPRPVADGDDGEETEHGDGSRYPNDDEDGYDDIEKHEKSN